MGIKDKLGKKKKKLSGAGKGSYEKPLHKIDTIRNKILNKLSCDIIIILFVLIEISTVKLACAYRDIFEKYEIFTHTLT